MKAFSSLFLKTGAESLAIQYETIGLDKLSLIKRVQILCAITLIKHRLGFLIQTSSFMVESTQYVSEISAYCLLRMTKSAATKKIVQTRQSTKCLAWFSSPVLPMLFSRFIFLRYLAQFFVLLLSAVSLQKSYEAQPPQFIELFCELISQLKYLEATLTDVMIWFQPAWCPVLYCCKISRIAQRTDIMPPLLFPSLC